LPDVFFPQLRGVKWGTRLTPVTSRTRLSSVNKIERSAVRTQQPVWKIVLEYEFLSEKVPPPPNEYTDDPVYSDFDTMLGFFLARNTGNQESFLFQGVNAIDSARFTRDGQKVGVGDGAETDFQLVRSIGEFDERIQNPVGPVAFAVGGVDVDPLTVTDLGNGLYRFAVAPAAAAVVTASFRYAYRAKFDEDEIELANFMAYFWEAGSVPLITVKR
jgi:uncharacterized protein (TIGR02217 family)